MGVALASSGHDKYLQTSRDFRGMRWFALKLYRDIWSRRKLLRRRRRLDLLAAGRSARQLSSF